MANDDSFPVAYQKELERAIVLRGEYLKLRGAPRVNVEFALRVVDSAISQAQAAVAAQDVVAMLASYEELQSLA